MQDESRGAGRQSPGNPSHGSRSRPHFVLDVSLKRVPGSRRRSWGRGCLVMRSGPLRGFPSRGRFPHPPPAPTVQLSRFEKGLFPLLYGGTLTDVAGGEELPPSIRSPPRMGLGLLAGCGQGGGRPRGFAGSLLERWRCGGMISAEEARTGDL